MRELLIQLIREGFIALENDSIEPIGEKLCKFLNDCLVCQSNEDYYANSFRKYHRLPKGIHGIDFNFAPYNPEKEYFKLTPSSFYVWDDFSWDETSLIDYFNTTVIPIKQILPYI